jgi:hypothetical protein
VRSTSVTSKRQGIHRGEGVAGKEHIQSEISCSHGGEYECDCFLGCCAV